MKTPKTSQRAGLTKKLPKVKTIVPDKMPRSANFITYFNTIPVANATANNLLLLPCQDYLPAQTGGEIIVCGCTAIYCPDTATWYYPVATATLSPPATGIFSYIDGNQLILTVYNLTDGTTTHYPFAS